MSRPAPLVEQVARLIERTYDFESGVRPLGRFIVGDRGHAILSARGPVRRRVDDGGSGARLLLRPLPAARGRWAAALYLPDALVARLEQLDPRRVLGDENVDAFATLVEEVDHLLTFADRIKDERGELSLLELEWHAGVTKYLVLTHFIARLNGPQGIGAAERAFVEHHLFHKGTFIDDDPAVRARYRDANRFAVRLVRSLRPRAPEERLRALRRFHRASHHEKLREFAA